MNRTGGVLRARPLRDRPGARFFFTRRQKRHQTQHAISAPDQLIAAVQKVAGGGQYVSDSMAEKLIFDLRVDSEKPLHKSLSDREFQVLCMIASGKKLTQIAQELHLSIKTISTYRTKLLQKMGMKNNVELVHYAIENHLVA